jgi:hypothetical protein
MSSSSSSSSSLRDTVCSTLQSFILNHENEFTALDILRVFEREARLAAQTQLIQELLRSDPFEHLMEHIRPTTMDRISKMIAVQEHHVVLTKAGYSNILGVVRLQADERMKRHGAVSLNVELTFSYERQIAECNSETGAASMLYFIEVSRDNGPAEKLLWIEIFAHGATPSHLPLKNLVSDSDEDEDSEWEDIPVDQNDDEEAADADGRRAQTEKPTAHKRKSDAMSPSKSDEPGAGPAKNGSSCKEKSGAGCGDTKDNNSSANHNDDKDDEKDDDESDRYRAGMDPEVLSRLLEWTQIGPMDDITAFFLLMTFPFYEQEFELVGPFLDSVFGSDDDDDDDPKDMNE